jgi:hypothetical protein
VELADRCDGAELMAAAQAVSSSLVLDFCSAAVMSGTDAEIDACTESKAALLDALMVPGEMSSRAPSYSRRRIKSFLRCDG